MFIEKSNIRFIRLQEEDIELLRHWRNHNSIQKLFFVKVHLHYVFIHPGGEHVPDVFSLFY